MYIHMFTRSKERLSFCHMPHADKHFICSLGHPTILHLQLHLQFGLSLCEYAFKEEAAENLLKLNTGNRLHLTLNISRILRTAVVLVSYQCVCLVCMHSNNRACVLDKCACRTASGGPPLNIVIMMLELML